MKFYWKMFTSFKWIRSLSVVDEKALDFPYKSIKSFCPPNAIISINLGTPGDEQKISMLGYVPENGKSFFAKYSIKEKAKTLSRNEIRVLKELEGKKLSPTLLEAYDNGDEVFFMTTRVCGKPYSSFEISEQILDILISLGSVELQNDSEYGLAISLSHGDFCPWNMLQNNNRLSLIDWEMATIRPLGYDLFMFIIHTHLIMGANENEILKLLTGNADKIRKYFNAFNISDYQPYLISYLNTRLKEEQEKGNAQMITLYNKIFQRMSIL